jgi:hypothetical protein
MIVAGCKFGRAGRGGVPAQCAKSVVTTITVLPVGKYKGESLEVCQEHLEHFDTRRAGTIYREVNGQPTPELAKLVTLY